ncbi:hypothetical protein [Prevotella intermedia]|uniref:hypothetical protein n=1 Tax=Prevotella intermedia TaxID=28131 RepID=UPI000680E609|nr:hypothetical protein [Prevotella intermedia]
MGTKMKILLRLLFLFIPFTLHAQSDWVKEAKGEASYKINTSSKALSPGGTIYGNAQTTKVYLWELK